MFVVEAEGFKQLVVVLLGQGDGDAVVVVLHQLLAQEDERLTLRKKTHMFEVKDGRELLDELVGCLLLADDDEVVDVAEDRKLMAYPNTAIRFQLLKMQLRQCCAQMLLPEFGRTAQARENLVEMPDDAVVLDELPRWNHEDLRCDGRIQEG